MKKVSKNPRYLILKVKKYEKFKSIAHTIQLVSISILTKYELQIKLKSISLISFFFKKIESFYNWRKDSFCTKFSIAIITADKSCCGTLNSGVLNSVLFFLKNFNKNNNFIFKIYILGVSGLNLMKRRYRQLIKFTVYSKDISNLGYSYIYNFLVDRIVSNDFDRFLIFFNFYVNRLIQKCGNYNVPSYEFLWLNYWKYKYFFEKVGFSLKFKKMNYIYNLYLIVILANAFHENELSSYGARAKTMENAVSNAEKIILYLRLKYNKLRQSGITNQIIEVLNASIV